jgi:hypothetical protein
LNLLDCSCHNSFLLCISSYFIFCGAITYSFLSMTLFRSSIFFLEKFCIFLDHRSINVGVSDLKCSYASISGLTCHPVRKSQSLLLAHFFNCS